MKTLIRICKGLIIIVKAFLAIKYGKPEQANQMIDRYEANLREE